MKQVRTCAVIAITAVWAVAAVWGQSQPKAKPRAAATSATMGVEVKVTRIQETRYRDFGPDATGDMSSGTQVSLGVTGGLAGKAHQFGKLKIEKAVDDKGTRLTREESPFAEDMTKGFVSTQRSFAPTIANGFGFDIPLGSAKRGASNIAQLKGSFLILSGTKGSVVIPDVAALAGKEATNPELKAAHVAI